MPSAPPPSTSDEATAPDDDRPTGVRRDHLRRRTLSGYAWMMVQTAGTQVLNVGGFVALGWLLDEAAFGLFVQTLTVAGLAALVGQIGVRSILVRRFRRYAQYANPTVWLMGILGVTAALVMVAAAPLVERAYDTEGLAPLIVAMAIGVPFNAVMLVPEASLQARMQFRFLAVVQFVRLALEMGGMIALAALGFGAWSLVAPRVAGTIATSIVVWAVVRPPVRARPQWRRWRAMVPAGSALLVANLANYGNNQADRIALSIFHPAGVVGVYAYGLRLAQRPVLLLSDSLVKVLLPVLSAIEDDPARQARAYERTTRLLAVIGALPCAAAGVFADPLARALLPERWHGTVPVLWLLGPAMLFVLVGRPAAAMLEARSRWNTRAVLNVVQALTLSATVGVAAWLGGMVTVAAALAAHSAVFAVVRTAVALEEGAAGWWRATSTLWPALPAGVLASAALVIPMHFLPRTDPYAWATLIAGGPLMAAVYAATVRLLAPKVFGDLLAQMRDLVRRRQRSRGKEAAAPTSPR